MFLKGLKQIAGYSLRTSNKIIMDIKICCRNLLAIILLVIISIPVDSQVVVERSKEKIIISGIAYYMHLVKKGETAYSISKAYGITVEELTRENPQAVFSVNEGQSLRIPVSLVKEPDAAPAAPVKQRRDENKYIYHNLQPGETVYFLSKSYGVSENDIILSNPGIDINKLPVGAEIAVPKKAFMTEKQDFAVLDSKYIFHKVVRGESMSSIAGKYGLTVRELRRENRDIRFPQVGDYLRIPVAKLAETPGIEPVKVDTVVVSTGDSVIVWERPEGYTPVRKLEGSFDVAVLLPFYLKENADRTDIDSSKWVRGKRIMKLVPRDEDWIYSRSITFIEMYEGILLAADTLRSLGLNINIHTYDIKSDTIELTRLIMSGDLDDMDLIIGPIYSYNLAIVAAYAGKMKIPVVSPVALYNNSVLINNPYLFIANSSLEVAQNYLAKKASEFPDYNFVFIHTDTAGTDQDEKNFKDKIIAELSTRIPNEEIRFKEFLFYSRSTFDNDSISRLSHALSESTGNVVIIASEDGSVISEAMQDIHALMRKFDIKVLGYPAIRALNNLDPKYFFDLDIMIYSPYWIDYKKRDIRQFNSDFRKKFLTEPVEDSYSWEGYDITYYFLSGLAIHGKDFILHPEIHNPDLLQTEFDFVRKSNNDGLENQKLFLVRYTKDYEVELVREDPSLQE
jgi:LysM repeat protein/ABC-type branched-subunit amino acid transport system substrate-binding protein